MKLLNETLVTNSVINYINRERTLNMFFEAKEKFQRAGVTVKEYLNNPSKYDKEYKDSNVYVEEDKGSKKNPGNLFYICPSFTKAFSEGINTMIDSMSKSDLAHAMSFSVVLACSDGFVEISFSHKTDSCKAADKLDIVNKESKYPQYLRLFYYHGAHVLTDAKNIKKLAKDNGYTFALATAYPNNYGEDNCVQKLIQVKGKVTKWDGQSVDTTCIPIKSLQDESFISKAFEAIAKEILTGEKSEKVNKVIEELAAKGVENDNAKAAEKAELKSGNVANPFKSKKELMDLIDEIGKTKTALQVWDKKHESIWKKIADLETKVAKQLDKEGYSIDKDYDAWKKRQEELQEEYGVNKLNKDSEDLLSNPDYKELNDKIYVKIAKRLEDSLSKAELKKIGKRRGYMYNLMAAVIQKYEGWDPRKE